MPFPIEDLLADASLTLITTDLGEALICDWYEFSGQPESFVEMRFGAVWERVQCDVQSVTARMGRDLTSEAVEAGTCVIRFDNRSGRYTDWQDQTPPINEATEIRVRVRYPSIISPLGEQVLWWGYVQEWEQEWTRSSDTVVVTAVDAVSLLVEQGGTLGWSAGGFNDTVLTRLGRLLSRAGLSYRRMYAEQGRGGLINPELVDVEVLNEIQKVADTDGGHFFVECDGDGFYFVYLNRERFTRQPIDIQGTYILPVSTATVTATLGPGTQATTTADAETESLRIIGQYRLGQPFIPLFSDQCGITTPESYPYTGLEWRYRGWEIPSLVAVSNMSPPCEVDRDGKPLAAPWDQIGSLASGGGRRHNVQEWTNLEFITQDQAHSLAETYAAAFSRSNIDVSLLEVHPELDDRLWDVVGILRQGDWLTVERNLVTDRLTAMCSIEGIQWDLVPSVSGGEPRWKVTYRLHSLSVRADPIPPSQRAPLPPTVSDQPPLPDVPKVMSLDPFGAGSTFTERGAAFDSLFVLRITDPNHGDHQAFARNEDIGTVQLPLLAQGTYSGDVITRQFGGIPLTPGAWQVWIRDRVIVNRYSDTQVTTIPEWEAPAITAMEWLPETQSTVSYTDDRYPEMAARVFATGRGGVRELQVLNWRGGNRAFQIDFNSAALPPGTWEIWVQDPVINTRQSIRNTQYKAATGPTGLRLGIFSPLDEWDVTEWATVPVVCNPVTDATGYEFEIKDLTDPTVAVRNRNEVAPSTDLNGGRVTSGNQTEKRYEIRVRSKVNAELSGWSNPIVIESGYPAFILRKAMPPLSKQIRITTRDQVMGMVVPGVFTPPGSQSTDPAAPRFVGTQVTKLTFANLLSQVIFGEVVNLKLNFAEDGTSNLRHVIGSTYTIPPGGASGEVHDGQGQLVTQNPNTPYNGSFPVEYILGSASRFIGIRLEGTWWGLGGPAQPGAGQGGWTLADSMTIEGTHYLWMPAKYPRQL